MEVNSGLGQEEGEGVEYVGEYGDDKEGAGEDDEDEYQHV